MNLKQLKAVQRSIFLRASKLDTRSPEFKIYQDAYSKITYRIKRIEARG